MTLPNLPNGLSAFRQSDYSVANFLASVGRLTTPLMNLTHTYIGIPRSMLNPVTTSGPATLDEKMGAAAIYALAMLPILGLSAYATYADIRKGITHIQAGQTYEGAKALGSAATMAALATGFFFGSKYVFYS